jgi:hypothetical protein
MWAEIANEMSKDQRMKHPNQMSEDFPASSEGLQDGFGVDSPSQIARETCSLG